MAISNDEIKQRIESTEKLRRAFQAWQKAHSDAVRHLGMSDVDSLLDYWDDGDKAARRRERRLARKAAQ